MYIERVFVTEESDQVTEVPSFQGVHDPTVYITISTTITFFFCAMIRI